jgi:hypothetical protein
MAMFVLGFEKCDDIQMGADLGRNGGHFTELPRNGARNSEATFPPRLAIRLE